MIIPITAITIPPATLDIILPISILPLVAAADPELNNPNILPPMPPPAIPTTEFYSILNKLYFIILPAILPPSATLKS